MYSGDTTDAPPIAKPPRKRKTMKAGQFQAIADSFDGINAKLIALTPLGLTVSNPPTQADVQALADKLDELINTLSA